MSWIASLVDLEEYLAVGVDAAVYFVLAGVATLAFLVKLSLEFFFGGTDLDFDPGDVEAGMDSTSAFTFFSVLSVLSFFMGVGWMGLACRLSWGLGAAWSATTATGFGVALMSLSAGLMHGVRRMTHVPQYDVDSAVGRVAKVYLTIPRRGEGQGQIEVTVSGRRKVMSAVSAGAQIPAFASVKIVAVGDDEVFVVEPTGLRLPPRKDG